MFEDRSRIARDLHDVVIQRLFAAGLAIQGIWSQTQEPDSARRLSGVVDELDETIREMRSVIFSLQAHAGPAGGLRAEILQVTHDEQVVLGFEARVHFEGVIDTTPDEIAVQLLPTLREALSNVGQHAQASSALVTIATNDTLTLRVQDNGVGISGDHPTGEGIRNAERRAAGLGGSCEITAGATGGTIFEWSVPLHR